SHFTHLTCGVFLCPAELWHLNRTWFFHGSLGPLGLRSMLLDEYQERLFIGGRDVLYSLSLDRVSVDHREAFWPSTDTQVEECLMKGREQAECANYIKLLHHYNKTHLLACGTGAFDPVCAFVRVGRWPEVSVAPRDLCPMRLTGATQVKYFGGELYVALYTDYWENDSLLCRLGNSSYTRTERNDKQQLNEPKFVGSAVIPDNDDEDDDKVYFFFTEKVPDAESGNSAVYARIGRVCANDVGGRRMLVNKWTSFLKTRLICSVPGPSGIDTHFDELGKYTIFTWNIKTFILMILFSVNVFRGYAVCVYGMDDIRAVFSGPYSHREGPEHRWSPFTGRVPFPRPGSCASRVNGGTFSSSRDFPDEALRFVRDHPTMFQPVLPLHRRPVLLQTDGERRLTQIAVDRVEAEDGHYDVLFLGTDSSVVLKVITIYNKETDTMEEVLLEELQVFKVSHVTSALVLHPQQQLYVGSEFGVSQVRLHQCDLYGPACADCCLARDPYCAWDGLTCSRYYPSGLNSKRRFRRQDIRHGNAIQQCREHWEKADERLAFGVESNSTLLECSPRSPQAQVLWFKRSESPSVLHCPQVVTDDRVIKTAHGLLFLHLRKTDAGTYRCLTVERGFVHVLATHVLEVLQEERVGELSHRATSDRHGRLCLLSVPPQSPKDSKVWFKELHQLLDSGTFHGVEEYCEKVWCSERKRKRLQSIQPRWKYSSALERQGRPRGDRPRLPRHTRGS
uniref:Sema domain, immunoglobulin domain (Ig), short basic domain, secreted, (semaphorin) 3E n=1 Tax=Scleropages formosus TaxID=113540 RepID=A0A8C9SLP5_SCLFO